MNGAEALLRTAAGVGADICFANPGTTELALVAALDGVSAIRPVLGLTEAVCIGAADGYSRFSDRIPLTILHMGPGLANGLAYLHNARRAATPILNIVGDHTTWHLAADAPTTTDIATLAAPMSASVSQSKSSADIAQDTAEAIRASRRGPVCLIVPADALTGPAEGPVPSASPPPLEQVSEEAVEQAAVALRAPGKTVLFLGGEALSLRGLQSVAKIEAATGCLLVHETFPAKMERGRGLPAPVRLPLAAQARAILHGTTTLILAGSREPVSFFGYEGSESSLVPRGTKIHVLAESPLDRPSDVVDALERLAERLKTASAETTRRYNGQEVKNPTGALTPETFVTTIAATQPEHSIIVDESLTTGFGYHPASVDAPRHTYVVPHLGGAIGHGLPAATGAALACPDRPVMLLEADGSGMYTVQSLWTQARENLNVTTVICSNRSYAILQLELGGKNRNRGGATDGLLNLTSPDLDWVHIAEGLGVSAARVTTAEDLASHLQAALRQAGPHLIEAVIA